ncbi:hypothetical protein [Clostridium sp. Marseille-Q2269]|uniref:hypothetical protein n=1 Tax=Clostridium sp. Marseille-Q2269 TaxID=2942205 RepID=UPI002073B15D|nr:hypothetical protein [Clostridium sp. Marseille-Q2269]
MEFIFNEYCPLKKEDISEGECIEITAELDNLKKEDHILEIGKKRKLSKEEMLKICESCPNYEI